jgi:predicted NUDIX family NTP pyrophosphohydrolase
MAKRSAGILLYRVRAGTLEFLLAHPGGPFWAKKDAGAWTIPKGEIDEGEEPEAAARREFAEETGFELPANLLALTPIRQRSGKMVHAWAAEGDCDPALLRSNTFLIGNREFPEIDRAAWFTLDEARERVLPAQLPLLVELSKIVASAS